MVLFLFFFNPRKKGGGYLKDYCVESSSKTDSVYFFFCFSYRRNIEKLRSVMKDEPMPPLERAVWWTEHVLRHGGAKHLRSPAANMSWWQYLELELVFTVVAGFLAIVAVFFTALFVLYKKFTSGGSAKVKRS